MQGLGDTNAFAHAIGNNRFMNLGFNFNPVLLIRIKLGPRSSSDGGYSFALVPLDVFRKRAEC